MQTNEQVLLSEKKQTQFIWHLLAFLVGLGLRLWRLGAMSFTLAEAQTAQGAWQLAMGNAAGLPGNMSYAGLSALLFYVFEPSFFFARLLPVILGSSLILIPWFWRDVFGEKPALVLAFGLAIDPILLSFSRLIVTPIFVLAGLAWAVTALKNKRPVLAGSMFGLAFLGGYTFWVVAIIGTVVFLVWRRKGDKLTDLTPYQSKIFVLPLLTSFIITLLVVSSAFLLCTEGLGGIGAGLVELFQLFGTNYKFGIYQPLLVTLAYSLLPTILGIRTLAGDLRSHRPLTNLSLLIAWALSIVLSVVLGRRDLGMLAFAAVFVWLAASRRIARIFEQGTEHREIVLGITVFQIVVLVYMQMVSRRLASLPANSQEFKLAFFALLAGLLLLVISTLLVGMGWSRQVSKQALLNSLLIGLLVMTVGLSLRSVRSDQESMSLSLLADPILLPNNDVAVVSDEIDRDGRADKTEITYYLGNLEQQFAWFFREQVDWNSTQSELQADLMLSESAADFSAADTYRGRNVVLFRQIDQQVVKPVDFLKTLFGEPLPLVSQNGILWVRLDLFTGAN